MEKKIWKLHYKGREIGREYPTEEDAIQAYIRLRYCIERIGWKQVGT